MGPEKFAALAAALLWAASLPAWNQVTLTVDAKWMSTAPADTMTAATASSFPLRAWRTARDLLPIFGTRGRVSEVLSGKRAISKEPGYLSDSLFLRIQKPAPRRASNKAPYAGS